MTLRRSRLMKLAMASGRMTARHARPILGFKPGYVFDVSQTDGEPLPAFAEVSGEPGDHVVALKAFVVRPWHRAVVRERRVGRRARRITQGAHPPP